MEEFISREWNMDRQDAKILASIAEEIELKKTERLEITPENRNDLLFIQKGIIRYWIQHGDKELTFDFSFPGDFLTSYYIYDREFQGKVHCQVLENVKGWRIPAEGMKKIFLSSREFRLVLFDSIANTMGKRVHREYMLLGHSPTQRYLDFLRKHPDLYRKIPLKHVASYIGITPEALSRIRKRIS